MISVSAPMYSFPIIPRVKRAIIDVIFHKIFHRLFQNEEIKQLMTDVFWKK